ncbi:MAG: PQQ-dependent sugar dehydrogenase [Fibrobacterota bacterium]|nr:PQQ-dependent sugar dehydrogenase [Fibrobacterota bacterium]
MLGCLGLAAAWLFPVPVSAQETCVLSNADFKRTILVDQPAEPMKLTVLPDGRVVWTQKRGEVMMWQSDGQVFSLGTLPVEAGADLGLHGITHDPNFAVNNWIYVVYDPKSDNHPEGVGRWVSRFTLSNNKLDMASEKKILHVRIDRNLSGGCCHHGGALAFDPKGNLYWSIGENSDYVILASLTNEANPNQNSLRSAGNTNDLRGKVVRIHPEPDGSYTIPEGNLFPKGLNKTRPEIFAMGLRNPFSLTVDPKTGWLWVGEVGTDQAVPTPEEKGAVGYEEINLLTKAAHLGYPFVNGPNDPFRNYDYVNKRPLEFFDPEHLVNNSNYNTGLVDLAPAGKPLPALVYWTVRKQYSTVFQFGEGKTAGMVGPTYRFNPALSNSTKLPAWLDGKTLFWDHEREIIRLITLTADNKVAKIDSMMTNVAWRGLVDIQQGPNGSLYTAEYGHGYYTANPTAKISRIDYVGQPCGSVSLVPSRAASAGSGGTRLVYADPSQGLTLDLPAGSPGADIYDLKGGLLWRSAGSASSVTAPATAVPVKGLVLIRYR